MMNSEGLIVSLVRGGILSLMSLSLCMCARQETATAHITGRASLGPIEGATVRAVALNADGTEGAVLATAVTDAEGQFVIDVPRSSEPVVLALEGGSFQEESDGTVVNLGTESLRSLLKDTASDQEVGVDALTEIAAERALSIHEESPQLGIKDCIEEANDTVAEAAGLENIVEPADHPDHPENKGRNRGKKALVLAGISQLARGKGRSSVHQTRAFAEDFKDGNFNGRGKGERTISILSAGDILGDGEWGTLEEEQLEFVNSSHNRGKLEASDITTVEPSPDRSGSNSGRH